MSSLTIFEEEQRVSPVEKPESLVTAPISPAVSSPTSVCLAPNSFTILPILSSLPVLALNAGVEELNLPLTTLKYESLPINGSATVLKQIAASGPFSSAVSSTGSPSESIAYSLLGPGQTSAIKSRSISHAIPVMPESANTGIIEPSATPSFKPLIFSSVLNSSPSKYFSISSSSVEATASAKTALIASKRGSSSCVSDDSFLLTPSYS